MPTEIGNLSYLTTLILNSNHINSLPENSFTGLINLTNLNVSNNYLSPCTMSTGLKDFFDSKNRSWQLLPSYQINTCPVCGNSITETGEVCDD